MIALGYDALAGIDALLFEQERGLHNGGPVEPERADAIARLKELHQEIGELLNLAEADQPLAEKLARVRTLKDTVLAWTASPAGFAIGALPLTGAATALGVGVAALVSAMARGVDATTVGVAVAGVHVAAAGIQSQRRAAP